MKELLSTILAKLAQFHCTGPQLH